MAAPANRKPLEQTTLASNDPYISMINTAAVVKNEEIQRQYMMQEAEEAN